MLVNDIKAGMRIKVQGGLIGTMGDNRKGVSRQLNIENGISGPEMSSDYVDKIVAVEVDGQWEKVELTPKQREQMARIHIYGF